jgi:hypothetical protein
VPPVLADIEAMVRDGSIVPLIIGLTVVEGIVLTLVHRFTGRGPQPAALMANLAAGACLLLALRSALRGDSMSAVSGWLAAGFVAHLCDVTLRWR